MKSWKRALVPYMYLLPHFVLFALFMLWPILRSFQISFFDWGMLSPKKTFVGLKNFRVLLFEDPDFWRSFQNTLHYTVLTVPALIVAPLALAVLFKEKLRFQEFFQTSIFLPLAISVASAGIVFRWIMDPQIGILNYYLLELGLPRQEWLNFPGWAMLVVSVVSLWGHVGFATIILLAAVKGVPEERYEAAMLDGAGRWAQFWHITVPGIKPALIFVTVTRVIESFNVFGEVYMVTDGGPFDSTRVMMYHLYETAFRFFRMGQASAMAWLMFVLVGILTWAQFKLGASKE